MEKKKQDEIDKFQKRLKFSITFLSILHNILYLPSLVMALVYGRFAFEHNIHKGFLYKADIL